MGGSHSRHRPPLPESSAAPEVPAATQAGASAPSTTRPTPSYPTTAPYPYPGTGDASYATNGRAYGGWPVAPQPYPGAQPAYGGRPPYPQPAPPAWAGAATSGGRGGAPGEDMQELKQTATIRNAVNLKKVTLKVTPHPSRPGMLTLAFGFDAAAPCAVTVFQGAREELGRGCRLTPAAPPQPAALYPRGLGQAYPPVDAEPAVLDPAVMQAGAGAGADPGATPGTQDTFPLVIRLESVSAAGTSAGKRLEDLVPGAEQESWVQSQTTFARLHAEEDGTWSVRVAKQKIWVDGVSYELQEIYGLGAARAGGDATAGAGASSAGNPVEDAEERLCVICLVNPRDTTVLPCRHMCMCHECAQELRKQTSKCPICRNHVESLLHIRMSRAGTTPTTPTSPASEPQAAPPPVVVQAV